MAKSAPKKKVAAKAPEKAKPAKSAAKTTGKAKAPKPLTKNQILATLAEQTQLTKKQVVAVLEALEGTIAKNMKSGGPGVFVIPNLVKITKREVPARAAGERKDPFTGAMKMFPAKPASERIAVRPLKRLKSVLGG